MPLAEPTPAREVGAARAAADPAKARVSALAAEHFQFIWRVIRRLGLPPSMVDDATQRVFEIATVKVDRISAGSERAFLVNTAVRVSADMRRRQTTRRETYDDVLLHEREDPGLLPDEATETKRRREMLDAVLFSMPLELRTVFVLFELERLPTAEIAALLGIPTGTVASRLRRAREDFHAQAKRIRARVGEQGGDK